MEAAHRDHLDSHWHVPTVERDDDHALKVAIVQLRMKDLSRVMSTRALHDGVMQHAFAHQAQPVDRHSESTSKAFGHEKSSFEGESAGTHQKTEGTLTPARPGRGRAW